MKFYYYCVIIKLTIPFPNMWDIPGGKVEEGESPEQALLEEK
jgi:8-oxo-dGTP pyrophosphatase MutT (NUDIX family)